MQKIYRKLTQEQKSRGVVFSSCLSITKYEYGVMHEVKAVDPNRAIIINRLKNDKFFNNSHFKYNICRR